MAWNRHLWGVEFRSGMKDDPPMIIGAAWYGRLPQKYVGEPSRALLFNTREQARKWCKVRNARDSYLGWKYTPIKVRELVEKVSN